MIILTRAYNLLTWLLPQCEKFPRTHRFVATKRLQDATLDFQELLFDANAQSGETRLARLREADARLNAVRLYLRLAFQWQWLNPGQHEHVSRMVDEIGKLLGGWIRQTKGRA